MADLSSRITIIAIGINKYNDDHLPRLKGAYKDIEKIRSILTKNKKTSIFNHKQFIGLRDPSSFDIKKTINEYVFNRSAEGDILIFYFSGHGVAIGRDDFGFCTPDTIIHPTSRIALPFSLVKFSEILQTLNIANIIPVIIIDACYSGIAAKRLTIPPIEAISTIQNQIHTVAASTYALLCACSEFEPTIDTSDGGVFSNQINDILIQGEENNSPTLTLHDVFNKLSESVLTISTTTTPRLYLGPTLPKFPIALNSKFKTKSLTMSPVYISILKALWNNGKPKSLTPDNIRDICGNGAYGNHNKLSLAPWQLVETTNKPKTRKLTKRGKLFMQNKLTIPLKITLDAKTKEWVPLNSTKQVKYSSFSKVIES